MGGSAVRSVGAQGYLSEALVGCQGFAGGSRQPDPTPVQPQTPLRPQPGHTLP